MNIYIRPFGVPLPVKKNNKKNNSNNVSEEKATQSKSALFGATTNRNNSKDKNNVSEDKATPDKSAPFGVELMGNVKSVVEFGKKSTGSTRTNTTSLETHHGRSQRVLDDGRDNPEDN